MWVRNGTCCKCSCPEKCTPKKINALFAIISGFFFATGWWCFIDAVCVHPSEFADHGWYVLPGLGSTAAFGLVNIIAKVPSIYTTSMTRTSIWCWRMLLLFGFFILFSMVFAALLMFLLNWVIMEIQPKAPWSYAFAILHTLFIAIAAFIFYFGVDIDIGIQ